MLMRSDYNNLLAEFQRPDFFSNTLFTSTKIIIIVIIFISGIVIIIVIC